ncbi:hypothetical protein F4774DRAFT_118193 [Daldinia eschscholtzii]|nr:hypothetical protein F4774DRAFT_118193 [Daldinia eschscholtzii]
MNGIYHGVDIRLWIVEKTTRAVPVIWSSACSPQDNPRLRPRQKKEKGKYHPMTQKPRAHQTRATSLSDQPIAERANHTELYGKWAFDSQKYRFLRQDCLLAEEAIYWQNWVLTYLLTEVPRSLSSRREIGSNEPQYFPAHRQTSIVIMIDLRFCRRQSHDLELNGHEKRLCLLKQDIKAPQSYVEHDTAFSGEGQRLRMRSSPLSNMESREGSVHTLTLVLTPCPVQINLPYVSQYSNHITIW